MQHTVYIGPLPEKEEAQSRVRAVFAAAGQPLNAKARFAVSERGKPLLLGAGEAGYSISHTGGIWVCACGPGPVGVDVERERACDRAGIARRFFHPQEQAHLEQTGYADFFRIWTAKESYAKFTGRGIDSAFKQYKVCAPLPDAQLWHFAPLPGVIGCLCAPKIGQVRLLRAEEIE